MVRFKNNELLHECYMRALRTYGRGSTILRVHYDCRSSECYILIQNKIPAGAQEKRRALFNKLLGLHKLQSLRLSTSGCLE